MDNSGLPPRCPQYPGLANSNFVIRGSFQERYRRCWRGIAVHCATHYSEGHVQAILYTVHDVKQVGSVPVFS
jgi:hypothetical protein